MTPAELTRTIAALSAKVTRVENGLFVRQDVYESDQRRIVEDLADVKEALRNNTRILVGVLATALVSLVAVIASSAVLM